jgi:hypothetical protein
VVPGHQNAHPAPAPGDVVCAPQEDDKLRQLVARHGCKNWTRIASLLPSKVGKQCRRRWQNHLNATLKTHVWTTDEDRTLLEGHRVLGNKWTEIARMVTGRYASLAPFFSLSDPSSDGTRSHDDESRCTSDTEGEGVPGGHFRSTDNAVKNRFMALNKKGVPEDSDLDSGDGVITPPGGRTPTQLFSSTHTGSPRPATKSRGGSGNDAWLPSSPLKRDSGRAAKGAGDRGLSGLVEAVAEASTSYRHCDDELEAPPLLRSPQKRQRVTAAAAGELPA